MPYTVARTDEVDKLLQALSNSQCAAVIGLSNTGKSTLLRNLCSSEIADRYAQITGRQGAIIYIDCNRMVEVSSQGLYELVLRCVQESIPDLDEALSAQLAEYYRRVVEPDTQFLVPLNFNNAMTAIIESGQRDLVLLLDEFDEAFDTLDGRAFLNLRALKDKYPSNLCYVTATVRRLGSKRSDEQTAEFVELSAANTYTLRPFTRGETEELANALVEHADIQYGLGDDELSFLWRQSGGHPRLLRASISHLIELRRTDPEAYQDNGLTLLGNALARDVTIRAECTRIWGQIGPEEREALLAIATGVAESAPRPAVRALTEWGLVTQRGEKLDVFSDLMSEFVRRQATVQREVPSGVWVDEDSGDVWVEGVPASPLTELEFRLLSLLHIRLDKVTDKYQIVEAVWGVNYIDEVDDARIEKLVSRLRGKIEPDPSEPRYIITVRGRGYKLVN